MGDNAITIRTINRLLKKHGYARKRGRPKVSDLTPERIARIHTFVGESDVAK